MAALTWNPADKHADIALSNTNLDAVNSVGTTWRSARATGGLPTTYKSYFEVLISSTGATGMAGIADATSDLTTYLGNITGGTGGHGWVIEFSSGNKMNAATGVACLAAFAAGDTLNVAFDPATGNVWFGKNGTFSGSPTAGTGAAYTVATGTTYYAGMSSFNTTTFTRIKSTAATVAYAAPTGFTPAGDPPFTAIAGSTTLALAGSGQARGIAAIAGNASLTLAGTAQIGTNRIGGSTALTLSATGSAVGIAQISGTTSLQFAASGQSFYRTPVAGSTSLALAASGALSAPVAMAGATTLAFAVQAAISSNRSAFFRQKWLDVYNARQTLLNKIASTINATATAAQTAATNAANQAAIANAALADIASDNLLTPGEKPIVRLDYDTIIAEQAGIDAKADDYLVVTEKATYDAAVSALSTYLTTLTSPSLWSDFTGNTTIVGSTFRSKFSDVYAARQAVLNKIVGAQAVVAGDTLLLNADMEMPDSGWTKEAQWSWSAGTYVRAAGGSSASALINQKTFAVSPGQVVRVTGLVTNNANAANGATSIALYCYDSGGAFLALPRGNLVTVGASVRSTGIITVPAGAVKAAVCFYTSGHTAGTWTVDSARCTFISESLDEVPDGSTYGRVDIQDTYVSGTRRIGMRVPGSGHRIGDNRNLPMIMVGNGRAKVPAAITYSATSTAATISVSAFTLLGGDYTVAYSASSVGVSGTASTTTQYYLYMDDAAQAGGARTLVATTVGNDAYGSSARLYIGDCSVTFPASGTSSGGGGRDPYCVTEAMWLDFETQAGRARDGQLFDVIDLPRKGTAPLRRRVRVLARAIEPCVRLTTYEGFALDCSHSTPFDLPDGGAARAPDMAGKPVWTDAGWQLVARVEPIGEQPVVYLSFGGCSYAAGVDPARRIYSHNVTAKP